MWPGVQHEKKSHNACEESQQRAAVRVSRLREVIQVEVFFRIAPDKDPPTHTVRGPAEEGAREPGANAEERRQRDDRPDHTQQKKTESAKESC